jgi:diamine N-acetyltransferase
MKADVVGTEMIKGKRVELRAATLADMRIVWEWSELSDIAPLVESSDGPHTLAEFRAGWQHCFADEISELGHGFIILFRGSPVGFIAYNDIDSKRRVELDIWMSSEANCGKGFGPDAIEALCTYVSKRFGVRTFMMQPRARNPRAVRAYEKVGFVRMPATPEQIRSEWGGVDHQDSVLMIRAETHTASPCT